MTAPVPAQAPRADTVASHRSANKRVAASVLVAIVLVGKVCVFAWPRDRSAELQARVQDLVGGDAKVVAFKTDGRYTVVWKHFYEYSTTWSSSDSQRVLSVDVHASDEPVWRESALEGVRVGSFEFVDGEVVRTRRHAEFVADDPGGFRQHIEYFGAKFATCVSQALDETVR